MKIDWNLQRDQWETLANHANAPMQQRWTYGAVHQSLGGVVTRAAICHQGEPVAICQILHRKIAGVIPVALATHGPAFLRPVNRKTRTDAIHALRQNGQRAFTLFTLDRPTPTWRNIPLMKPTHRAVLALNSAATTRAAMHQKWRASLTQGLKNGMRISERPCDQTDLEALIAVDQMNQTKNKYTALPPIFIQNWQKLAPQDLRLLTATHNNSAVAFALFLTHGNTATYYLAHATDQGRAVNASRVIIWDAIQKFIKQGVLQIDLGVIDTELAPGLARFKLGTGAFCKTGGGTILAV